MNILTKQIVRITPARLQPCLSTRRYKTELSDVMGETRVDQTKHNNDPNEEKHDKQMSVGHRGEDGKGRGHAVGDPEGKDTQDRSHPAKQPPIQETASRSTGIKSEGTNGKDGSVPETGDVYKNKSEKPGPGQTWG